MRSKLTMGTSEQKMTMSKCPSVELSIKGFSWSNYITQKRLMKSIASVTMVVRRIIQKMMSKGVPYDP